MTYQVRLQTDIQLTIQERLSLEVEQGIADTLRQWLDPIFSGHAHDLTMNFYSLDGQDELRHSGYEVIDAKQKSFTLYIPREDYMHLAVVNITDNEHVSLTGTQHTSTLRIDQAEGDILPSQNTAIYTARQEMRMSIDSSENFDVHLYMVSSAIALVIDTLPANMPRMDVLYSGGATGFAIMDSTFTFDHPSLIRAERLMNRCYSIVALPSRGETDLTKSPSRKTSATREEEAYWELRCYVPLPNGKTTETVLSSHKPLKAGTLEIVRVNMRSNGALDPLDDPREVGATVTLDWKEGGEHNIDL